MPFRTLLLPHQSPPRGEVGRDARVSAGRSTLHSQVDHNASQHLLDSSPFAILTTQHHFARCCHLWTQIPTASITPAQATSVSAAHSTFLTLQPRLCLPKLLPSKYPSLTFALCKYSCVQRLIAQMFAEREQGQIEMRFQILMNIWGKHSLPQPQLFTQPPCAVKRLLTPTISV